ncbi:MAG TPA: phage tail protein [Gaiellaceae bacterium]|jgi:phage tail-like protein|nr:phage tail protein [Gaiellaceae bacterium]
MELVSLDAGLEEQHHVLLSHGAEWRALSMSAVEEAPCEGDLRLIALPGNGRPLVDPGGTFGGLDDPTGVAVDPWGVVYLSDATACVIKRFDPCCGDFEPLPCLGGPGSAPRQLRSPHGLAVSRQGVLYVADTDNRRVQLFSLKETVLLAIWGPIDATGAPVVPVPDPGDPANPTCTPGLTFPGAWRPWDIALDSRGRAYVTDYANGLVHAFDRHGRWRAAYDGAGPGVPALAKPTALAIDLDDRLYVAQEGVDSIVVLDSDGTFVGLAGPPEGLAGRFRPTAIATDPNGDLFVADSVTRRLHCYRCPGPPGTPVQFTGGVCTIEGPTTGLAFDRDGNPLAVADSGKVFQLQGVAAFAQQGTFVTTALDSGLDGCAWHRVALAGQVPDCDAVRVDTFTSDVERTEDEILALADSEWDTSITWLESGPEGVWDCLVLSLPGRYLWLRLALTGSGKTTPTIHWAKVYFPRESSIQYLPAVFRSTPPESTFLERFLSIFDTLFASVEDRFDRLPAFLDPDSAPWKPLGGKGTDWLSWVASWFGLEFEGRWGEARRRNVLRHIFRLYRWRGTRKGLREAVLVMLGLDPDLCAALPFPGILEWFELRRWLFVGDGKLGDNSTLWGKRIVDRLELSDNSAIGSFQITGVNDPLRDPFWYYAHKFTLFVPASMAPTDADRVAIERIVEISKPAHAQCVLELVEPRFRVGVQATIGLDTAIGRYPSGVREGEATLGYDSVLQDSPTEPTRPEFRVGDRARIGTTVL